MNNPEYHTHVRGESHYIDDMPNPGEVLYAAVYYAGDVHAIIKGFSFEKALAVPGVKKIITAADIPGQNQVGNIISDETLLADTTVHYRGQPVALVIAESKESAHEAASQITVNSLKLPFVLDAREAYAKDSLIIPPRVFESGDIESAWEQCDFVIEGKADSGGQEHLYLETQAAMTVPLPNGKFTIYSSTQSPTAVQKIAAAVLDIPMSRIEVEVERLGGAFGGKEDQATPIAVLSALAASLMKKPVKLVLPRQDDMRITGKRHPYSSDYKIGFTKEGKILAYEVTLYQNAGAAADLSPAVLDRSLFHCNNSYFIPNLRAIGLSCRTNLPPNTAFRGFGGPQAMFVIEAAITKIAEKLGVSTAVIQELNLLREGDLFHYGQKAEQCKAKECWSDAAQRFKIDEIRGRVESFNSGHVAVKKGMAVMPVCFGISFTSTFLNQAYALVHIYRDGSVGISTGAVEMGQGVNTKLKEIAAQTLSLDGSIIFIETTNTTRIANTSATAASSGADLNGHAVRLACELLKERLIMVVRDELDLQANAAVELRDEKVFVNGKARRLKWKELIDTAYKKRISLSSHTHYATPKIHFDTSTNKGDPFAYHVYGTAIIEATVDCLRGTYKINGIHAVHDFGKSINMVIDRGQAEGALIQGIGWMTMEEVIFNDDGILLSDALSTYKVPDIQFVPDTFEIHPLEDADNPKGILKSKAVGEPPLMYGIGAYFAIYNALKAFRPDKEFDIAAPMTPERVLLNLYAD